MNFTHEKLKALLVVPGHIKESELEAAIEKAGKAKIPVEKILVEERMITDNNLGKIIADGLGYSFADLRNITIPIELLGIIPEVVARSRRIIIFERTEDGIMKLATDDPDGSYEFAKLLERRTGEKVSVFYTTAMSIETALKYYRSDIGERVQKIIQELKDNPRNEGNIVELVNLFLDYAHDSRASDIHIEPFESEITVRFRIDGILHKASSYPKEVHGKVVSRIKIMARLRTDEHDAPQDGRFSYNKDGANFDVRVSVVPISGGENVVMRILAESAMRLDLTELGLGEKDFARVKKTMSKAYGMILAVGPTGSGKTTTVYGILQLLNKPGVNIMTVEDPIEYNIPRVHQIAVNPRKELTFSTGLRSIVRQDPDIIMVGEIRDNETAGMAINSALTGHIVLSTMHTNDAATTFPRMIDMQVEPFLIASSINIVVAQRLVRKICAKCRVSYILNTYELKLLNEEPLIAKYIQEITGKSNFSKIRFYKGGGGSCRNCGGTGYSGRTGIFETIEVTEELRPLIAQKSEAAVISQKAQELGMTTMVYDGVSKILQGVTTTEEIIRVIKS